MKFPIFFPCVIISVIIFYPQILLINIVSIIITYLSEESFSQFLSELDYNFENVFGFYIL